MRRPLQAVLLSLTAALIAALIAGCTSQADQAPKKLAQAPAAQKYQAKPVPVGTWANWRGPEQNGISREKNLPEKFDPDTGENLLWRNEKVAGMSSPIVMNGRLYTLTRIGEVKANETTIVGPETQEAIVCLDAETGNEVWTYRINMYQTEVPFHRIGWGNVVGDPETNRVYGYATGGTLVCLDAHNGKPVWEHQMLEEYGMISTFGGRTQSPTIDEDQLLITGVAFNWGDQAMSGHRIFAFDKNNGTLRWMNSTGGRPVDAPQGTAVVGVVNGQRIVCFGAGDGGMHGFNVRTGKKLFSYKLSQRGINTSLLLAGNKLIGCSSEENPDSPTMGRIVCLDLTQIDAKTQEPKEAWVINGIEAGFPSPTIDPELKTAFVPDNKGTVHAIDIASGKPQWKQGTGTIGRPSLVWADNKIYAAEANGKFVIIQVPEPGAKKAKVLSRVELGADAQSLGREYFTFGSPAIANGRIYLQTAAGIYAIGPKQPTKPTETVPPLPDDGPAEQAVAHVQVVPFDAIVKAGDKVPFNVRTFDAKGRLNGENVKANWAIDQLSIPPPPNAPPGTAPGKAGNLRGTIDANGLFTSAAGPMQGGAVAANVGGVKGIGRVRVMLEPPYTMDFEAAPAVGRPPLTWVNAGGKFAIGEKNGSKVVVKTLNLDLYHLARTFFGRKELTNYTIESDVMVGKQNIAGAVYMPDVGVVNSRYTFVIFGNHQQAMLIAWTGAMPKEGQMGATLYRSVPFKWSFDQWHRMKLSVQQENGSAMIRGKVWKKGDPEPGAWTVELKDPTPNRSGSPGLFGESLVTPYKSEIYYDNIVVRPN